MLSIEPFQCREASNSIFLPEIFILVCVDLCNVDFVSGSVESIRKLFIDRGKGLCIDQFMLSSPR